MTIDLYEDNESMMSKLQGGGTALYDIVVPGQYLIPVMAKLGLLAELRHENIPNLANLDEKFVNPVYDPGNKYSAAYQWGTVGIYLRKQPGKAVDETWGLMFDKAKQYGSFLLMDSPREMLGSMAKYKGMSVNSTSLDDLRAQSAALGEAKQRSQGFEGGVGGKNKVLAKAVDAAVVYNGDAVRGMSDDPGDLLLRSARGRRALARQPGGAGAGPPPRRRREVHQLHARRQGRRPALELQPVRDAQQGGQGVHHPRRPRQPGDLSVGRDDGQARIRERSRRYQQAVRRGLDAGEVEVARERVRGLWTRSIDMTPPMPEPPSPENEGSRSALAQELALLQAVLDSTEEGLLVVDAEGRIVRFNQGFAELWRLPEEILATGDDERALAFVLDQLLDPEDFLAKVRELYSRPDATSEDILHFKDRRVLERTSRPRLIHGVPTGRIWSFRDVTRRYRGEMVRNAAYSISMAVHSAARLADLFRSIHNAIRDLMPAENFYIALHDPGAPTSSAFPTSSTLWRIHRHRRSPGAD